MRGRSLVVVAGAANVAPKAPMKTTLSTRGLEKLLAGYGMSLGRDVVVDPGSMFKIGTFVSGKTSEVSFPWLLVVKGGEGGLDDRSGVFFRVSELEVPFASSIVLDPARQPNAKLRVLARTSAQSRHVTVEAAFGPAGARGPEPEGPAQSYVVAASLEGRIASAFGNGASAGAARVLVIASSQFLMNPFVRAEDDETNAQLAGPYAQRALTSTIIVLKNTLDWMAMDEAMGMCMLPAAKK
jgi:hypothetical protein